ncbi:MAG: LacI family transcriptional regulator [Treponema sp.]|jgi:LacI family transcriptional regulator|nr:LacI family transcriptional regulator [Treponema sp.]
MKEKTMITLKEIAEEAGVSLMTVSNVVNGKISKVSREKREQIYKIIKKYEYIPNYSARSLAANSSRIIGCVLLGNQSESNLLMDEYNARFAGTVMDYVHQQGYYFMLRSVSGHREATEFLRSWNVDGAVFIGMSYTYIKRLLKENRIPLIFTDSYTEDQEIPNIGIDDRKGGRLAAECLLRHGHRSLGFICYATKDEISLMHQRLLGYRETLSAAGLILKEAHIHRLNTDPARGIAAIADAHISSITRNDVPTAYFTTADRLAFSLIRAFYERGIMTPQDISVIGFDNLTSASCFIPGLTTIAQDIEQKAKMAMDALFRRIGDPAAPVESAMLDVTLVERESTAMLVMDR